MFFEDRSIGQLCNWRRFGCRHLIAFAVAGQDLSPGLVDNYLIRVLGGDLVAEKFLTQDLTLALGIFTRNLILALVLFTKDLQEVD